MNRNNHLEYNAALEDYLQDDMISFKKKLKSPTLNMSEKKLLQSRCHFQQKDWEGGIACIENMTVEGAFLKAEQQFLLSSGHLFSSRFEPAIIHNLRAMPFYSECDDQRGLYLCYYNNSVAFSRLGLQEVSFYHLTLADQYASNSDEHLIIVRQKACYHSKKEEFETACHLVDRALQDSIQQDRMEHLALKSTAVDIYFRSGRQADALGLLTELKNSKMNWVQDRVSFEYALLKSLIDKSDLARVPEGIKDSHEYKLKWEIIKALQDGDSQGATDKWNTLITLLPQTYAPNFKCLSASEEKTIFYVTLQSKFIHRNNTEAIPEVTLQLKSKKLILLYQTLLDAKTPMRKEELIELIWGTEYCPSLDARFYQLIKRLRVLIPQEIVNKNNCYHLRQVSSPSGKCA